MVQAVSVSTATDLLGTQREYLDGSKQVGELTYPASTRSSPARALDMLTVKYDICRRKEGKKLLIRWNNSKRTGLEAIQDRTPDC